jgi:competence protein ComEA
MKRLGMGITTFFTLSSIALARVDINTANESELEQISGVGPVKAKSIVEYRQKHGAFKALSDLEKVPGFAATTVEKVRATLTIEEKSLSEKFPRKAQNTGAKLEHKDPRN